MLTNIFRYVDGLTNVELKIVIVTSIGKDIQVASCTIEHTLSQALPTFDFLHCFNGQRLALQILDHDVNTSNRISGSSCLTNF